MWRMRRSFQILQCQYLCQGSSKLKCQFGRGKTALDLPRQCANGDRQFVGLNRSLWAAQVRSKTLQWPKWYRCCCHTGKAAKSGITTIQEKRQIQTEEINTDCEEITAWMFLDNNWNQDASPLMVSQASCQVWVGMELEQYGELGRESPLN